jgi:hypothetical protein
LSLVAYTAGTWTAVIVACSIFIPLLAAAGLVWAYLSKWRHGGDEERLKRVQAEYEARQALRESPRR